MNKSEQVKNGDCHAIVTGSHRVQIPSAVVKKITVAEGNFYDIYCNEKLIVRKVNKDGRIRLTETSLPSGAKVNITVKDNAIHVSTR